MSNAVDLKQLIDAVRRQPGAPAYALLAERYIATDALAEAIEVCRQGFAANPAYERGAVAYLQALRGTGDAHTAARIYGRAIAEHPRSSRLRVAWAHVLADAGRMAEARLRAREAAELDPMSREARSLLASVGGTPPPALRNTGGIEALGDWPSVVRTPTPEGLPAPTDPQPTEAQQAEAAPRPAALHPLPGEPPVHAMFDFTPGPAMMPSIAPTSDGAPPLDELADLYELDAEEIEEADESEHEDTATATDGRPSQGPAAPPPLPHDGTDPRRPAPEQSARGPSESSLHFPSVEAQAAQQTPPSPDETRDRHEQPAPPNTRRRLLWVALPAVALLALAAVGLLAHRIIEQSRFERATSQLRAAMKKISVDDPRAYRSALQTLSAIAKQRPKDGRIAAAQSLVAAHLVLRFGSEEPSPEQFAALLNQARSLAPRQHWTVVAVGMYRMNSEPSADPMALFRGADAPGDWHLHLARGTAMVRQRRIAQAAASFEGAVEATEAAPAIVEAAARLARLRGLTDRAQALLTTGLDITPKHTGLMLQQALLTAELGTPPTAVSIAALTSRAAKVPRHQATLLLLQALAAHHEGQRDHAIALAETATAAHPESSAQAAWLAARWHMPPGGNVGAARAAFEDSGPPFEVYRPAAVLWRAQTLILHGAPHAALKLIEEASLNPSTLQPTDSQHLAELLVYASHATEDLERLRALCPPSLEADSAGEQLLATCAAVHLKRGQIATARRWIKRLGKRPTPLQRYLRALLAEAQGDGAEAYELLKGLIASPPLEHAALLLAQARAYMTRNDLASAVATFRDARRADGNSTRSRVALASALVVAAHDTEAITIIDEVLADHPTDPSSLSEAGTALLALGRLVEAASVAKAADTACPRSPVGPLLAGHVALLQSRLKAAHAAFREVLKRAPKNVEALIQLGQIAAKRGRKRLARRRFAAALRQRPKDAHLLYLVAHAHAQTGSHKLAHDYALRAIRLFEKGEQPGQAVDVMVKLGRQLSTGNRWARERGRELLFRASTSPTPPATALLELGRVYKLDKDLARALWCFRKATEKDPQLAAAQLEYGRLLYRRGKRRAARGPLKRYLELEPQSPEASRVRALLARKR